MSEANTHFWTASDDVKLAWHEVGQGRPVILLHGLFSDAWMNWIKFGDADRIASVGFPAPGVRWVAARHPGPRPTGRPARAGALSYWNPGTRPTRTRSSPGADR